MNRTVPSANNSLTFFLEKADGSIRNYEDAMVTLEISIEKKIKTLLTSIGVAATVKTDRYSLPYVKEIKHTGMGESYLNGAFEIEPFLRTIAKEILNEDLFKIRFYVLAEIEDRFPMGQVNYYFRYYPHNI